MNVAIHGCIFAVCLVLPGAAGALPPDFSGEEQLTFRLLLGNLDGAENDTLLRHDGHRYTVALSGSSPIAWGDRIDANMEIWITERSYQAPTTSTSTDEVLTLKAEALTYGVRLHPKGALRPYGLLALGFQATHLRTIARADGSTILEENSLEPTLHVGLGLEWQMGQDSIGLDWRRWYASGDFALFGTHDVDLGGDYVGLSLGHRW